MTNLAGRALWITSVLGAAGCGNVQADQPDAAVAIDSGSNSNVCAPNGKFGAMVAVPGLSSTMLDESTPRLTPDELTVYFTGRTLDPASPGGVLDANLYTGTRATKNDAFTVSAITALDTTSEDQDPTISADGKTLWFSSLRTAKEGYHIYRAQLGPDGKLGAPTLEAGLDGADKTKDDGQTYVTADGAEMWFTSSRAGTVGGNDIWRAPMTGTTPGTPVAVSELSSASNDWLPVVTADRLTVYFSSNRPGSTLNAQGVASYDIWTAHRTKVTDDFPAPTRVTELSTTADDFAGWISADNCRFYMSSIDAQGQHLDVYMATRSPPVPD